MTDCNGWDNYATWRVNVEYGDHIESFLKYRPDADEYDIRQHVRECSGIEDMETGVIRDLLVNTLNFVSWDCLVEHYTVKPWEKE